MWLDTFRILSKRRQSFISRLLNDEIPLDVEGSPFASSVLERASGVLAARLPVHRSAGESRRLVFVLPNATQSLGRFLAVSLLLADFVHRAGEGVPAQEKGRLLEGDVLFVTQHIQECVKLLRSVAIKYRSESLRLSHFWPIQVFSQYSPTIDDRPRVFVANPGWSSTIGVRRPFGSVVVDVSHPRTVDHLERLLSEPSIAAAPVQVLLVPPWEDDRLKRLHDSRRRNCFLWAWDPASVDAVRDVIDNEVEEDDGISKRYVWICDDNEINKNLAEIHQLLVRSMQHLDGKVPSLLFEAWSVYHRLRQLAVPLLELEEERQHAYRTVTLQQRLSMLEGDSEGATSSFLDAHWPAITRLLRELYETLMSRREPDKFYGLAACIEAHLKDWKAADKPLRIVVPTAYEGNMLAALLGELIDGWSDALQDGMINICTVREEPRLIAEGHPMSTAILGFRTSSTRYLDVYPGDLVNIIAYPYEAMVDEAIQRRVHTPIEDLQADQPRNEVLTSLFLPVRQAGTSDRLLPHTARATVQYRAGDRLQQPASRHLQEDLIVEPVNIGTLAGMTWTDEVVIGSREGGKEIEPGRQMGSALHFVEVIDSNGNRVRYPETRVVDVYYPATEVRERIPAGELRAGTLMVVLVDEPYQDLYQRLLEAIEKQRDLQASMALELWQQAKHAALVRCKGSRRRLHEKLRASGISVDYPAVVGWYANGENEILAPQTFEDFRILAGASGIYSDEVLIRMTFSCIRAERMLRRLCGKKLSRFLAQIVGGQNYDAALMTAKAIGTPLEEVASAVCLREVCEVLRVGTLASLEPSE